MVTRAACQPVLSPLQTRIARLVATLPEADSFALAGGAALIVHRVVDRRTDDLDFFTSNADDVSRLVPAVEAALGAAGLQVSRERVLPTFARLTVSDDSGAATVIDIAWDYRLSPAVKTPVGLVLAEEELAADKLLALAGRVEARDYLDVARLVERLGLDEVCRLAQLKDPGFRRWALADMLEHFDRIARQDFDVDDREYEALRRAVSSWRTTLGSARAPWLGGRTAEPPSVDR